MPNTPLPADRLYSDDHEWIALSTTSEVPNEPVRIGITQLAVDNLGELVYLDLPDIGASVTAGQSCGEVESTKTVSDLVSPVSGTVEDINTTAASDPALITSDPYGAGWLFTVHITGLGPLLTAAQYAAKNGLDG